MSKPSRDDQRRHPGFHSGLEPFEPVTAPEGAPNVVYIV